MGDQRPMCQLNQAGLFPAKGAPANDHRANEKRCPRGGRICSDHCLNRGPPSTSGPRTTRTSAHPPGRTSPPLRRRFQGLTDGQGCTFSPSARPGRHAVRQARAARSRQPRFIADSTRPRRHQTEKYFDDTLCPPWRNESTAARSTLARVNQALAMAAGGSVTVLEPPELAGIASGSGISVRPLGTAPSAFASTSRASAEDPQPGEQPGGDLRARFKDNEFGPMGETIVLRYQRGLFLPNMEYRPSKRLQGGGRRGHLDHSRPETRWQRPGIVAGTDQPRLRAKVIAEQPEATGFRRLELALALTGLLDASRGGWRG